MNLSTSDFDGWLPPPEKWRVFACERCEAEMRVPFPPSDRLCGECRESDRRAAEKTLEERLADAGAPSKLAAYTREHWERRYGSWTEHDQLRRLEGWPREHDASSWLVLITGPGYGNRKAELATAVLGEAISAGLARGRWLSQTDWLRQIKASWDGRRSDARSEVESEHVVWRAAADADVLLFEDLGGFGGFQRLEKSWWRLQVTELLHYRERQELPTIVTANVADWRELRRIHESLPARMNVPLKILLEDRSDV